MENKAKGITQYIKQKWLKKKKHEKKILKNIKDLCYFQMK